MFTEIFLAQSQQTFQNVAPQLGISGITGLGHSVGWGDIDNDGDPDLAPGDQSGNGYWLFQNDGDVFTNITYSSGLTGMTANKTIFAEFNNDGNLDLKGNMNLFSQPKSFLPALTCFGLMQEEYCLQPKY